MADTGDIIEEIAEERRRQQDKEGYGSEHDDDHDSGQLAMAAASYAMASMGKDQRENAEVWWPFEDGFKPEYGRRDLIRAAALIVAEVERLDRASASGVSHP